MKLHFLLLFALLPASAAVPGCSRDETPDGSPSSAVRTLEVDLIPVRREKIASRLELVGTLLPIRGTTIVPDVDGIIDSFPDSDRLVRYLEDGELKTEALGLNLGHAVKEGEILVKIEDTDFRLAVEAAQAELDLARRLREELVAWKRDEEKLQAEAQLDETTAAVELGEAELKRAQELHRTEVISQAEFDVLVMNARCAVAARKRAQAALDIISAGPTPEQIAVADARIVAAEAQVKLRQDELDKTTIRAPYDGVIVDRFVDIGDRVQAMPRAEIMQIIDPQVLFAQISVPERYQGRLKLFDEANAGDETAQVWVEADSLSQKVPGRLDLINVKVDPETRTYRARVLIDNREAILKPGGFVRVSLPVESAVDVAVVPEEAVSYDEGQPRVFVYRDGSVEERPVSVGISNDRDCEICSGLSGGELVVAGGTSLLTDGLSVSPREADPAAGSSISGRDEPAEGKTLAAAGSEVGR